MGSSDASLALSPVPWGERDGEAFNSCTRWLTLGPVGLQLRGADGGRAVDHRGGRSRGACERAKCGGLANGARVGVVLGGGGAVNRWGATSRAHRSSHLGPVASGDRFAGDLRHRARLGRRRAPREDHLPAVPRARRLRDDGCHLGGVDALLRDTALRAVLDRQRPALCRTLRAGHDDAEADVMTANVGAGRW